MPMLKKVKDSLRLGLICLMYFSVIDNPLPAWFAADLFQQSRLHEAKNVSVWCCIQPAAKGWTCPHGLQHALSVHARSHAGELLDEKILVHFKY